MATLRARVHHAIGELVVLFHTLSRHGSVPAFGGWPMKDIINSGVLLFIAVGCGVVLIGSARATDISLFNSPLGMFFATIIGTAGVACGWLAFKRN